MANYNDIHDFRYLLRYFFDKDDYFDIPLEGESLELANVYLNSSGYLPGEKSTIDVPNPKTKTTTTYRLDLVRYWRIIDNAEYWTVDQRVANESRRIQKEVDDERRRFRSGG